MNTICLIRCEPNEYHRDLSEYPGSVFGLTINYPPLFYPDNDSRNCLKLEFPLLGVLEESFESCNQSTGGISYSITGTTLPGLRDICRIGYLASPGVTIEYLPQDYGFSYEKSEEIRELSDGSLKVEAKKLKKKMALSGDNLIEAKRVELESLADTDYIYVAGLNEGNFYGILEEFSFNRISGLTGIYSYNLSIKEA